MFTDRRQLHRDSYGYIGLRSNNSSRPSACDLSIANSFFTMRRERLVKIARPALQTSVGAELVLAADQFVIHPAGRLEDAALAHATGDEERTIIAGYHWFTDWGRDTMINV